MKSTMQFVMLVCVGAFLAVMVIEGRPKAKDDLLFSRPEIELTKEVPAVKELPEGKDAAEEVIFKCKREPVVGATESQ